jgi:very-short-patch-repair endonuclease
MRNYRTLSSGSVDRARDLRRNATDAEKHLRRALREAFPAAKFRHQVPFGPYFADFLSFGAKLIVEVDGGQHGEATTYDAARTRFLESQGYRVLRFWNNDVLANTDGVIAQISLSLQERVLGRSCPRHDLNSAGRCSPNTGAPKGRKGEVEPRAIRAQSPSPSHSATLSGPLPLPLGEGKVMGEGR